MKEPDPSAEKKDETFDFGFTSVSKKDKKKKKNSILDSLDEPIEEPTITPAVEETKDEDEWGGGWGTAKTKKKGKKGAEPDPPKVEEVKAPEPAAAEDEWSFGAKKDKKKKGKNAITEVSDSKSL